MPRRMFYIEQMPNIYLFNESIVLRHINYKCFKSLEKRKTSISQRRECFEHTQFLLVFHVPYVVEIKQKEKHPYWMEVWKIDFRGERPSFRIKVMASR